MTTHSTRAISGLIAFGAAALVFILALGAAPPAHAEERCPRALRFDADGPATDLDPGWTGVAHDNHFVGFTLTMGVSGCEGTTPPCGTCTLSGPLANGGGATFNNRRCVDKTWLTCVDDADCVSQGAAGPCHVFLGPPHVYAGGNVGTCVTNEINGALTGGSTNVEAGTIAMTLPYRPRVYVAPADHPCPQCIAGFCDDGPRIGQSCTTSGTDPLFGNVSFDCPPEPMNEIGYIAPPVRLFSTSDQTMTLSAASPSCRAPGYTGLKCFCDTCATADAEPCSSNADCPGGAICGGRRCQGGSNEGAACARSSECPSGGCGVPGKSPAPNECNDLVCRPNTPPDGDSTNEGECSAGPFELLCAIETFRFCETNTDCPKPGDSCALGKFRECFTDNGVVGKHCFGGANHRCLGGANLGAPCVDGSECPASICFATVACDTIDDCPDKGAGTFCGGASIEAGGVANPPVGNTADATLGSLFCIPPTMSGSVNAVSGFPGPGRFTLPGTLTFVGDLNHFTCYNAGATRGSIKFPGIPNPPGISLVDQFGSSIVEVKRPKFLCAPTNKLGEDPTAPLDPEHLKGYQIKNLLIPGFPPANIKVVDQFNPGGLFVDTKRQSHLLVPTVKDRVTPPPLPGAFAVDHFQCYKVRISKNKPKFEPVMNAEIEDQFGIMHVDVKKPTFLCNPVDKNGEDPSAPTHADHLMCYQVRQVKTEPAFQKVLGVFVNNQFGPEQLDVKKPSELCVPATSTARYIDNGDGTVTDKVTGLQWEKKTTTVGSGQNYADPHNVDNYYTWTDPSDGIPRTQTGRRSRTF